MSDFTLSEAAWEAAAEAFRAAGYSPNSGDRTMVELQCSFYLMERRGGKGRFPTPARYAEAWLAVSKSKADLLAAIDNLEAVGAARLEVIGVFGGGYEVAEAVRLLPELQEMARVVAAIEAEQPGVPSKSDPARDRLARSLIDSWLARTGSAGATEDGPASRFLAATYAEAVVAAEPKARRPKPGALRHLLRKHGGELRAKK